jgi:hypothetical protein
MKYLMFIIPTYAKTNYVKINIKLTKLIKNM